MEALVARVHESSSVCVLDEDEIVYVARVPTRRIMTVAISVGSRFPAYATSMGRVLLAHQSAAWLDEYLGRTELRAFTPYSTTDRTALRHKLADVHQQGYAIVDQELELGLRSIAVPIRRNGDVIAAVNVSMHVSRGDSEAARAELLPPLLQTATAIEADLGGSDRRRSVSVPSRSR